MTRTLRRPNGLSQVLGQVTQLSYYDGPMMQITQGLKRAVQVNASGIATIDVDSGRRRTWKEFANRVAKLAGALQSLGLKTKDRVAIISANSDYNLEYYFATIWAGGIFVPLNTRLASREIGNLLTNSGAKILVIGDRVHSKIETILEHSPKINHLIFAGEGETLDGFIDHETFLNSAEPVPDKSRGGDDVATIMYTGGTTGIPKGAMLTHTNCVSNALSSIAVLNDGEPWVYLHTAPMFHIADSQWNTGVTMQAGTHVFVKKFDPELMLSLISETQLTHIALVPTMINMMCNVPNVESYDVSSLRKINFGGSSIAPAVIRKARKVFPQCEFIQGYGQTETAPNISMLLDKYNTDEGPFAGKIASAGQPVFVMNVRIVDENDEEVPSGTVGEIAAKGPHVMAGYWNNPEETKRALRNGWMHTGDVGYMDEDGFIFIVDRLKDMIISGGENVYSTEVENTIHLHSGVKSCAMIGIPHEKWGEGIHAIVVPKDGENLTENDIKTHCREYIADYKCPVSVEIRLEPLPMSGPGKILKKELRKPFWPDEGKQIH